jgi:acylphosphatase
MGARQGKQARRFIVKGRVQGVGYRWWAQNWASQIGVSGWVRNCDDGSVEVYACGSAEQLDEFSMRLRQGPRFSDVRHVEEQEAPLLQSSGFSIRS